MQTRQSKSATAEMTAFSEQDSSAYSGAGAVLEQAADQPNTLSALPDDVVTNEIVDHYLSPDSTSMLAKAFSTNSAARRNGLFAKLQDIATTKLLLWVILHEKDAINRAAAIIDRNPTVLLSNRVSITHRLGYTIKNRTPLQVALDAGDVTVSRSSAGMSEMIIEKILEHYGIAECRKQYAEWVISLAPKPKKLDPETITDDKLIDLLDAHFAKQQSDSEVFDFTAIPITPCTDTTPDASGDDVTESATLNIIERIRTAPIDHVKSACDEDICSPLWQDLELFRDAFDKMSHSKQTFNPYHLLKALEIYYATLADPPNGWGHSDDARLRRDLLWRQVIGYAQRDLPTCDAQALAKVFDSLAGKNWRDWGTLFFVYDRAAFTFLPWLPHFMLLRTSLWPLREFYRKKQVAMHRLCIGIHTQVWAPVRNCLY